jgi:hypothetical protein
MSPYMEAVSHTYMTLPLLHSEFPYTIYEENLIFFFYSVVCKYFIVKYSTGSVTVWKLMFFKVLILEQYVKEAFCELVAAYLDSLL